MSEKADLVSGWLAKADSDLAAGQFMLADGPYDIVCFHAQQAIEKLLKTLLVFYDQPPPRTHDLEELQRLLLAIQVNPSLAALDLFEVSDYAVMARYDLQPSRLERVTGLDFEIDDADGYDGRGNLKTYTQSNVDYVLSYGVQGRLTSAQVAGQTTTFLYDDSGQRVRTTYPDGTKVYTLFPDYELEDPPGSGANTIRTTHRLAGQIAAVQKLSGTTDELFYALTDHLGSIVAWSWTGGTPPVTGYLSRYEPFGGYRTRPDVAVNPAISSRGFTGHSGNNTGVQDIQNLNLIYMNARYYMPEIGRFISADTIVPEAINPQSFNRYSYSYNNPINYTDSSGHCIDGITTWACVAIALKVVDYGWTAWDTYQSGRVLANPNSTSDERFFAALNVSLAIGFEMLEPDDFLPVGLPADDIGRRALVSSAKKAYTEGGAEAVEAIVRDQLGDNADVVLNNLWDALCCSGQKHHVLSNKIMTALGRHETLAGIFKRNDIIVQALDLGSHNGYQSWHIKYDDEIVRWLAALA